MSQRLSEIIVDEISLVGKGANRRRFHLFKEQQRKGSTVTTEELMQAVNDLADDDRTGFFKSLGVEKKKKAEDDDDKKKKKPNPFAAFKAAISELTDDETDTLREEVAKRFGLEVKKGDDDKTRLSKMDPKDRALIEKAQAAADAAQKEAAANAEKITKMETDRRRQGFLVEVAKYEGLPHVTADDFGTILDKIDAALDPKEMEKFRLVLKASSEQLLDAAHFKEIGSGGGGLVTGGAYDAITAAAEELRKSDNTLTAEGAWSKVYKENAELRAAFTKEDDARKRRAQAGDVID